jgi:RNA polymerase sigma factor (TIGR02999 family)
VQSKSRFFRAPYFRIQLFIMSEGRSQETVALLMANFRQGDSAAASKLVELFYPELRRLAAVRMKSERGEHTWEPTALIHELYLELVKVKSLGGGNAVDEHEKAAFLGLSGHIMKRLLQHHARPLYRQWEKVSLSEGLCKDTARPETLQEVEDALAQLAAINPKLRAIVDMRVFEGLNGDDIAARLGCSRRSVAVYWSVAKRWLQTEWAGRLNEEAEKNVGVASTLTAPLGNQHVGYPPSDRGHTMEP